MKWFGEFEGDAPWKKSEDRIPTPVDEPCFYCRDPIRDGERGYILKMATGEAATWHDKCLIRSFVDMARRGGAKAS